MAPAPRRLRASLITRLVVTVGVPLLIGAVACSGRSTPDPPRHPLILVGVDGGDWEIIDWLWSEGRLPNLHHLADTGISGPLHTFHYASPVIWTTVATGVGPHEHGISDFVVATAGGDRPVSSTLRRVPALWNMASATGRRVAVVGWWASWPAEQVNGVVISDRALHEVPDRVSPPGILPRFEALRDEVLAEDATSDVLYRADAVMARCAVDLAAHDYDLLMLYFRGVDLASHFHWKEFRPDSFPGVGPEEAAAGREVIAAQYELADRTIGALLAASGGDANLVVVSDHGFEAMAAEEVRIVLDLDRVLVRLGLETRAGDDVDFGRSMFYEYDTQDRDRAKKVRFSLAGREPGGRLAGAATDAARPQLARSLERVRWRSGAPALRLRDAEPEEVAAGADLVVEVLADGASVPLLVDGTPFPAAKAQVTMLSGTHDADTDGILFAAGPDLVQGRRIDDVRVVDIPPTVLYALDLPAGEDFMGRARTDLFRPAISDRRAPRTIPTWGHREPGEVRESAVDEELIRQLEALGYLD